MLDKLSVIAWKPFSKIKNSIVSNFSINTENRQSTASTYIDSVSYKFSNERISIKENSNNNNNYNQNPYYNNYGSDDNNRNYNENRSNRNDRNTTNEYSKNNNYRKQGS